MEYTLLHTLVWLLSAFTFTTQELVKLSVSPGIVAECGKRVTLNCDASSSQEGLSIKHMEWFQSDKSVCSVNREGQIKKHTGSLSDFYCEYKHGQLSLILRRVKPQEEGKYSCKLQSNQGASHEETRVALQECSGIAEGVWTEDRLTCTFKYVHPDGDVHWFHGSHNLSDGPAVRQHTSKQVEEGGWLTIRSYLERKNSRGPYNCSLMSTESGRHIASTLVYPKSPSSVKTQKISNQSGGTHGPMWTFLCFSVLLVATLN